MPYQLIKVAADPNAPPFSLWTALDDYKTYIVAAVGIAKLWYVAIAGHPWSDMWDTAINGTLALLFGAAIGSALKTSTAKVVNAVVNPTSPAAEKTAAEVAPVVPPTPKP